jgi:hypothetical protein
MGCSKSTERSSGSPSKPKVEHLTAGPPPLVPVERKVPLAAGGRRVELYDDDVDTPDEMVHPTAAANRLSRANSVKSTSSGNLPASGDDDDDVQWGGNKLRPPPLNAVFATGGLSQSASPKGSAKLGASQGPLSNSSLAKTPPSAKGSFSGTPAGSAAWTSPQHIVIQRAEVLGRGGYGTVYRGYNKTTKAPIAVKECTFDEVNVNLVNTLRQEYELLSSLDNPHIVKVHHFAVEQNRVARIYMELMPAGSVRHVMRSLGGRFSEMSARRIVHQALLGLQYLHQRQILHRDLKPDNMLVDGRGIVKLSDFGTCKATIHAASGTTTMVVGTVVYMAPETITGRYSVASDVWAIAAAFVEMVSGQAPWHELGAIPSIAMLFHIGNARPPNHHPKIPSTITKGHPRRLVQRCFAFDPRDRPTVAELLADPYFSFDDFAGADDDHARSKARQLGASGPQQQQPPQALQRPLEGVQPAADSDLDEESLGDSFDSVDFADA